MPALKFDGTINIPTIGSFIGTIVTAVVFIMSIKGDVKVHSAELTQLKQEVGELRRIQMRVAVRQDEQEGVVKATAEKVTHVAKVAETNKVQIAKNTAVVKKLPELLAPLAVEVQPIVSAAPPVILHKIEERKPEPPK